jgi:hypothetical protein
MFPGNQAADHCRTDAPAGSWSLKTGAVLPTEAPHLSRTLKRSVLEHRRLFQLLCFLLRGLRFLLLPLP